jgi:hypothetical protein
MPRSDTTSAVIDWTDTGPRSGIISQSRMCWGATVEVPVLIESLPVGFRASTGTPIPLSADGPSADAAVAALQRQLNDRLRAGGRLYRLTVSDAETVTAAARAVGEHPLFDEWVRAIDDYRKAVNTVPDAD